MRNFFDYIDFRGDLSFDQAEFCEVDTLLLSVICYLNYGGIIPHHATAEPVLLSEVVRKFLHKPKKEQAPGLIISNDIITLAERVAHSRRFEGTRVIGYVNEIDEQLQMQFAAMTYLLPDGTVFIAYRGTDDNIIGWKEDCFMAISPVVPAQLRAAEYLCEMAKYHTGKIRLGGHSKGGNLAVYAAVKASIDIKERIIEAVSLDGPGFHPDFFDGEDYRSISGRLITYIPHSSVVGMLFKHTERYKIIASTNKNFMQHDPASWVVKGPCFIYEEGRSPFGKRMDGAIAHWIEGLSYDERLSFTESLFSLLSSSGAKTLTDLATDRLKSLRAIVFSFAKLKKQERNIVLSTLNRLIRAERMEMTKQKEEEKQQRALAAPKKEKAPAKAAEPKADKAVKDKQTKAAKKKPEKQKKEKPAKADSSKKKQNK